MSIECEWEPTKWGDCSKTCNGGRRYGVSNRIGGQHCRGRRTYIQSCNTLRCELGNLAYPKKCHLLNIVSLDKCLLFDIVNSFILFYVIANRRPGRFLEVCTSMSSYAAKESDELSFEAGQNIFIVLQNGRGW